VEPEEPWQARRSTNANARGAVRMAANVTGSEKKG